MYSIFTVISMSKWTLEVERRVWKWPIKSLLGLQVYMLPAQSYYSQHPNLFQW